MWGCGDGGGGEIIQNLLLKFGKIKGSELELEKCLKFMSKISKGPYTNHETSYGRESFAKKTSRFDWNKNLVCQFEWKGGGCLDTWKMYNFCVNVLIKWRYLKGFSSNAEVSFVCSFRVTSVDLPLNCRWHQRQKSFH